MQTKNPLDLALVGRGFFVVQGPRGLLYTRQGGFTRDSEGRLVTAAGYPLQADGGGDIVVKSDAIVVQPDGAVLDGGEPAGKVAVAAFADPRALQDAGGGLYAAPDGLAGAVGKPTIRQGALEASNVSTGDEMISIMAALRRAESGQRLMGVYDDLMGRALAAFGQV